MTVKTSSKFRSDAFPLMPIKLDLEGVVINPDAGVCITGITSLGSRNIDLSPAELENLRKFFTSLCLELKNAAPARVR